jgi:hypothetical protein
MFEPILGLEVTVVQYVYPVFELNSLFAPMLEGAVIYDPNMTPERNTMPPQRQKLF